MLDYTFLQAQVYVAVVAEEGSFSRAARRLGTSQSLVTTRIAKAERTLGAKLFDRTTRRLELTTAGRSLLPDVQLALRHAERAWGLARYSARMNAGPMRVGYAPEIHGALVPLLYQLNIAELEPRRIDLTHTPGPRPDLETASTPDLMEQVLRGELEAAVGIQPIEEPGLWRDIVAREALVACVSKNHPLALRPAVSARDLEGEIVFCVPRKWHATFHDQTLEYIHSTGAQPAVHEVASALHAIELTSHGIGIGLLPRSASRFSYPGAVFKPVTDRFLEIETAIFARRDHMRGEVGDFILFLASRLRSLKLDGR